MPGEDLTTRTLLISCWFFAVFSDKVVKGAGAEGLRKREEGVLGRSCGVVTESQSRYGRSDPIVEKKTQVS